MKQTLLLALSLMLLSTGCKNQQNSGEKDTGKVAKVEEQKRLHDEVSKAITEGHFRVEADRITRPNSIPQHVNPGMYFFHVDNKDGVFSSLLKEKNRSTIDEKYEVEKIDTKVEKKGEIVINMFARGLLESDNISVRVRVDRNTNECTAVIRSVMGGESVTMEGHIYPLKEQRKAKIVDNEIIFLEE